MPPLFESDACTGDPKGGGGPAFQVHTDVRRVDSAPGSCGTDMGSLLVNHSRSVCVKGKRAVHSVLLSVKLRCSPGRRRTSD